MIKLNGKKHKINSFLSLYNYTHTITKFLMCYFDIIIFVFLVNLKPFRPKVNTTQTPFIIIIYIY
jgi:hypothetical protein